MTQIAVTYLAHMGDDLAVVNDARVSFGKESRTFTDKDARLIGYLARNGHWTPFAHQIVKLRVKAPIFVRTQCFKHKVGFVENEISRRYVDDEPEFFQPGTWRGRPTDGAKQGSGAPVGELSQMGARREWRVSVDNARIAYSRLIANGVAPEQARMVLPQATMTEWIWTGSLAAWARFYLQRTDPHAQVETGQVARLAGEIIAPLFPVSWAALTAGAA